EIKHLNLGVPGPILLYADDAELLAETEKSNDQALAVRKAKYLDESNNVCLNIAITGESGSGKSSLINALRGIRNNTQGAAPTGVWETTMKPTEYLHPEHPNIRLWDLPGVGSTGFPPDKYLECVEFEKYDFFIIVSDHHFRENDAKLAKEIHKMKKKFYFVRSKIDVDIQAEREDDPDFNEEKLLKSIRENCTEELQELGFESPKVFLVSGLKLHLYEFKDLRKTLEADLPKLQRDALLRIISLDVIQQKKGSLESKIKWFTAASAAGAFTLHCRTSLGLTPESLIKQSDVSGVSLEDLRAELKSPLSEDEITEALIVKEFSMSATYIAAAAIEEGFRFIPLIGTAVAMAISSANTYIVLTDILNSLAEDAQQVFIKTLVENMESSGSWSIGGAGAPHSLKMFLKLLYYHISIIQNVALYFAGKPFGDLFKKGFYTGFTHVCECIVSEGRASA
uniref:IRG-type G domain-containing protein n=1 Tax=Neogobius melanostomus TaxID=47308 RepID=A0A8C6SQ97_9GOBI